MTGWRRLITATVRLANRNGTRLRRRAAEGRLLFEPAGAVPPPTAHRRRWHTVQPPDYVRGVLAGAWTLSAEICHDCGSPGDPSAARAAGAAHDAQTAARPATKSCPDPHGGGSGNPARLAACSRTSPAPRTSPP